jgi:hypothetical protein
VREFSGVHRGGLHISQMGLEKGYAQERRARDSLRRRIPGSTGGSSPGPV